MVTQRLNEVLNMLGKSSQVSSSSSSKDIFGETDFSDFLNSSIKSELQTDFTKTSSSNQPAKEEKKIEYKHSYTREKQVPQMDKAPVKSEKPQESKTNTVDKKPAATKSVQTQESKKLPDAIVDKVKELTGKIEDVVKDALGITQEELEGLMEFLGMQMTDLLNQSNLKLLALAANGETDFTAFLTNENLCTDLNNLVQGMEQINLEELGLTKEDLDGFMEKQQENFDFPAKQENTSSDLVVKEENHTENTDTITKLASETTVLMNAEELDTENSGIENLNTQDAEDSSITFQVEKVTEQTGTGTESGNDNKGNSSQAQVSQSGGLEQMIGNIGVNAAKGSDNFIEQLSAARQMRAIVNQIVDEIKVSIKPDATSMELQLNPANLGKVNLAVVAKDGVLTAQFTVQNAAAKEAIESQLQNLKDNLSNQGIKVEAVEVTVSNFSFDGNHQADGNTKEQKQSHRKLGLDEINSLDDLTESEVDSDRIQLNGSTVEYTV